MYGPRYVDLAIALRRLSRLDDALASIQEAERLHCRVGGRFQFKRLARDIAREALSSRSQVRGRRNGSGKSAQTSSAAHRFPQRPQRAFRQCASIL